MEIASALLLSTMIFVSFPRAKAMLKESPTGSKDRRSNPYSWAVYARQGVRARLAVPARR